MLNHRGEDHSGITTSTRRVQFAPLEQQEPQEEQEEQQDDHGIDITGEDRVVLASANDGIYNGGSRRATTISSQEEDMDDDLPPTRSTRLQPLELESNMDNDNDNISEEGGQDRQRLMMETWEDEEDSGVLEDPHAQGLGGDLVSAVLGIIKAMVGPAILYLPHGFAQAGFMTAVPILSFATLLYLSSSRCLLECWKNERSKQTSLSSSHSSLSYPDLAFRALGSRGESMVKIGIAAMQSGVCLTYLIFVPQNLHASVFILTGKNIPMSYFLIGMVVVEIPLSWIRNVRSFTVTNALANVLILYGLMACLVFAANNAIETPLSGDDNDDGSNDNANADVSLGALGNIQYKLTHLRPVARGWFLFIGTSVLLFEGSITLLVPLQEAVAVEEDKKTFPSLYWKVILGIIIFYCFFGIFCWLSFGDQVATAMTTSLPATNVATSVQLAYSIAVIFTFPLQNYPSLEITTHAIQTGLQRISFFQFPRPLLNLNLIASVLVCLLAVVAYLTLDSLDKVVSLMGSLLGCPLAFVFPPLIHIRLDPDLSMGRRIQNIAVASVGFCAMILATITTILTWNNE